MPSEQELKKLSKESLKQELEKVLTDIEKKAKEVSSGKEFIKSKAEHYEKTQKLTKDIREKMSTYENTLSKLIPMIESNIKKEQASLEILKSQKASVSEKQDNLKKLKDNRKKELYGENFDSIPQKKEIEATLSDYSSRSKDLKEKLLPTSEQNITDETINLIVEMSQFREKLNTANELISKVKKETKSVHYGELEAASEQLGQSLKELQTKYSQLQESSTKKGNFEYINIINFMISLGVFIIKTLSTASLTTIGTETTKQNLFPSPTK